MSFGRLILSSLIDNLLSARKDYFASSAFLSDDELARRVASVVVNDDAPRDGAQRFQTVL